MATLSDVAKRANVSKMTVSRVMNHPEKVTEELKQLVYQAMKDLDYTPNVMAKALAKNRTFVVKVMILEEMEIVEPYYMTLLTGIAQELNEFQYAVRLIPSRDKDNGDADGYIITGMRESDYIWIRELDKPVVVFGENVHDTDFVDTNNQIATQTATVYALSCGYEHLYYIGMDAIEQFEVKREQGYVMQMEAAHKKPHIVRFANRSSVSEQYALSIAKEAPKNSCFICATDRLALGLVRGFQKAGRNIPNDIGIIGFDGVFLDRISSPQLTTMRQPLSEMGRACARMIMEKIKTGKCAEPMVYFDSELVVRDTLRLPSAK